MLEVENLSPFPHLAFTMLDVDDEPWETVVVRGTYGLAPSTNGATTHSLVELEAQPPLMVTDVYLGEVAASSVLAESDLAPFKPRCDVIVVGSAQSPDGMPVRSIEVAVRIVRRPTDYPSFGQAVTGTVMEHRLVVHGERSFVRRDAVDRAATALVGVATLGGVRAPGWQLSEGLPFVECPIDFEHAFGGRVQVRTDESAVVERLDDDRRRKIVSIGTTPTDGVLLREEFEDNPSGLGFIEPWYAAAARIDAWPAPRIEAKAEPWTGARFEALVRGDPGQAPPVPDGFGIVAKHWPRRRKLAGTCDEVWERERCPRLPKDFDMSFWNGATPAMQAPRLFGAETVELVNLLPPAADVVARDAYGNATASFMLPRVGLMLRFQGASGAIYEPVLIDTLHVDLREMRVSLVWRFRMRKSDDPIPARLMALGPIMEANPRIIPGVLAAVMRGSSQTKEETV